MNEDYEKYKKEFGIDPREAYHRDIMEILTFNRYNYE